MVFPIRLNNYIAQACPLFNLYFDNNQIGATMANLKNLLRDVQVSELLCIGRSTVWLYASNGTLPKPLKLSPRVSVWKLSDIEAFIASRMEVQ